MTRRRIAILVIIVAVLADLACAVLYSFAEHVGIGHAAYCALGNAVTEGACTSPATTLAHWINVAEFVLIVPLFAAIYSFFTSSLTAAHVKHSEDRMKEHVEAQLEKHHDKIREFLGQDSDASV